jgi:hypothetical protein
MSQQAAPALLMIRPAFFGANPDTEGSNIFQKKPDEPDEIIAEKAIAEFDAVVQGLRLHDMEVVVIQDTLEPVKTDAIFPNNWISTHAGGRAVLYPMYSPRRRFERRPEILEILAEKGFEFADLIDLTAAEKKSTFLEGTGSLVFDYANAKVYACASSRTDYNLAQSLAEQLGMELIWFRANSPDGGEIYHTNVILSIADTFTLMALELVHPEDRERVKNALCKEGRTLIPLSFEAVCAFAGNSFLVKNREGKKYFILSETTKDHFSLEALSILQAEAELLYFSIPTIEKYGGGSIRCMLCALFH